MTEFIYTSMSATVKVYAVSFWVYVTYLVATK